MKEIIQRYKQDESGAVGVEYVLLAALAAGAIATAYTGYGSSVADLFTKVNTTLSSAL